MIIPVGAWVMHRACTDAARWRRCLGRDLQVAVNLSRRQFDDERLAQTVEEVLHDTGLPPALLEMEVTETDVMSNTAKAGHVMDTLRNTGVRLAMDDFGTGYSSLVYLKRFPLDRLKIDKEFVRDIGVDANDNAIVRTIIALADNLGLTVVAEGVETAIQRDFLQRHGCQFAQGYLYSRPLPAGELTDWLATCRA